MTVLDDMQTLYTDLLSRFRIDMDTFAESVHSMLPGKHPPNGSTHSRLNANGSPLQICITNKTDTQFLRVLVDPCHHLSGRDRYDEAFRVAVCEAQRRAPELESLLTITRAMLDRQTRSEDFTDGPLWMGVAPEKPGLAIYFDAAPLGLEAKSFLRRWVSEWAVPETTRFDAILRDETPVRIASFGFEGSNKNNARLKIHFRLSGPVQLDELGVPELHAPTMLRWLAGAVPEGSIDSSGLVISVGVPLVADGQTDAKIDVCNHCVKHPTAKWQRILQEVLPSESRHSVLTGLEGTRIGISFVGFGLSNDGHARTNLYLRAERS